MKKQKKPQSNDGRRQQTLDGFVVPLPRRPSTPQIQGPSNEKEAADERKEEEIAIRVIVIMKLSIHFPGNISPYPGQMKAWVVIAGALFAGKSVMAEIPTGNGKTMLLLSIACAFAMINSDVGMIIYAGKTHNQLGHYRNEFKRLQYENFNITSFASKSHLCTNLDVSKMEDISTGCREAIASENGCVCNNNLKRWDANELRKKIGDAIYDIEELRHVLKECHVCAYFASTRKLLSGSRIAFMPYNYILDPAIRNTTGISMKNAIVILDEAHNIADVCKDSVSYSFEEAEVNVALFALKKKIHAGEEKDIQKRIKALNDRELQDDCENQIIVIQTAIKHIEGFLVKFKQFWRELAQHVPEGQMTQSFDSQFVKEALIRNEIFLNSANLKELMVQYDLIIQKSHKDDNEKKKAAILNDLKPHETPLHVIKKIYYFLSFFTNKEYTEAYVGNVTFSNLPLRDNAVPFFGQPFRIGYIATLNFWCMSGSVGYKNAFQDVHSVVLASGTLCPMGAVQKELGTDFVQFEGDQVIPEKNMLVPIITHAPDGTELKCSHDNLQKPVFLAKILSVIANIVARIPKGVLVFVNSYKTNELLQQVLESEPEIRAALSAKKKIFFEPSNSRQADAVLKAYEEAVEKTEGAILFGVHRGKNSEGCDFIGDKARCVIAVGIPYASVTDERVRQDRLFKDLQYKNKGGISGDQYYSMSAFIPLNQALGRAVRGKTDWAVCIIIDFRFIEKSKPGHTEEKMMSRTIRQRARTFPSFDVLFQALSNFVAYWNKK